MDNARHKIAQVIEERKRLLEQSRANAESQSAKDKSQYIILIGGVAAGLTIAVIVWLAQSIVMTDHIDMSATDGAIAIHRGEITKLSDNIAELNARVEELTESVSTLEDRLVHFTEQSASIRNIDTKHAGSFPQQGPGSAASRAMPISAGAERAFDPTHIVKERVNLRPAPSLNTTPIAVLNVGSEVEFISKTDSWYHVNTQYHGKGWCSSEFLSPLSSTKRQSSTK